MITNLIRNRAIVGAVAGAVTGAIIKYKRGEGNNKPVEALKGSLAGLLSGAIATSLTLAGTSLVGLGIGAAASVGLAMWAGQGNGETKEAGG